MLNCVVLLKHSYRLVMIKKEADVFLCFEYERNGISPQMCGTHVVKYVVSLGIRGTELSPFPVNPCSLCCLFL